MKKARNIAETFIWTPLIGFDREHDDKGVAAYYSTLGFAPDGISLFLFCPDIVHYHDGLAQERVLPPDNCNYYGHVRNEIREIQPWTNHDLRDLVTGLEERGARTFMGLMGVFVDREPHDAEPYNIGHREWLLDHRELVGAWTRGNYSLNVLKRFRDGTYYEDFFLAKVRRALRDYGFSGLHVADNFCPPGTGGTACNGDFSDDMLGQFVAHSGLDLPAEIVAPLDNRDRDGIGRRGDYIWNRHKAEWLEFLTWRWGAFWKKICDGLHADGKEVLVNNAWCSEPFEAIYRYGIDYRKLHAAGVDYIAAESLPTSVHSGRNDATPYRFYEYMTMPACIKAHVPDGKLLCLNGVKDSTEEWSNITHFPGHVEREIYALGHYFLQTSNGLIRALDGLMVCLGDGLTAEEWAWLRARHETGLAAVPDEVLTPTLIWSERALARFLPDYIATRRWSAHKTVCELARRGGQLGVLARIEELSAVRGPIFVPNIDLLPAAELAALAAYESGPILGTSLVERDFQMPGAMTPDLYFQDPVANYKMCLFAYRLGGVNHREITAPLGEDDGSADIAGEARYAPDPSNFHGDLAFRKVSPGFIKACSRLLRALYSCELTTPIEHPLLPLRMPDGRIRVLLGNDNRLQYRMPKVNSRRAIRSVTSRSTFPAIPAKLLDADGRVLLPQTHGARTAAYGFITKVPPGGMTILDVELEGPNTP